jgi:hypothetical protein
MLLSTLTGFSS